MAKNNIRSIRFSDELAELIDQQIGDTFTEKFENLITRCVWELPKKEKELEKITTQIKAEEERLREIRARYLKMENTILKIERECRMLETAVSEEVRKWEL